MAEYSSTKLTPSSTTKFPANNGNTPGYVKGSDLVTSANVKQSTGTSTTDVMSQDAVTDAINANTALINSLTKIKIIEDLFSRSWDWSTFYTYIIIGVAVDFSPWNNNLATESQLSAGDIASGTIVITDATYYNRVEVWLMVTGFATSLKGYTIRYRMYHV